MSDPQSPSNPEVQELTDLARRFGETGRYEESADLLLLALRLEPKNLSVKLGLAEVRKLQQQHKGTSSRSLRDILREGFRRNAIDAAHFLGLAHLYAEKGENARAIECIEVAKAKDLANPANHKLHGRLLFRRRDFDGAVEEFGRALRYNPFDRETAESLGRAEYERKQFEPALAATVHAFLLLNDGDEEGVRRLRRRIQTLKQILGWGNRELAQRLPRAPGAGAHRLRPPGVAPRALPGAGGAAGRRHLAEPPAAAEAPGRHRRPARSGLPAAAHQAARPLLRRADLPLHLGRPRGGPRRRQPGLRPSHAEPRPLHAGARGDHRPAHHLLRHLRAGRRGDRGLLRRGELHHRPGAQLRRPRRRAEPDVPHRRGRPRQPDGELARAGRPGLLDSLAQPRPQAARRPTTS